MTAPTRSIILAAALALTIAPAAAQLKKPAAPEERVPPAAVARPPLCDPLNLIPGCRNADGSINQKSGGQGNPFDNLTDDVLRKILADVTYAKALAKAAGNDVTLPCWAAWVDLVTSQTAPLKDDAGNVLTQPDPHFFVAAERAELEALHRLLGRAQPVTHGDRTAHFRGARGRGARAVQASRAVAP